MLGEKTMKKLKKMFLTVIQNYDSLNKCNKIY